MEPFLYQIVHLYGGRARMLKEHVARLHVASCELFGVAPGQSAVLYRGEEVLCGGVIASPENHSQAFS